MVHNSLSLYGRNTKQPKGLEADTFLQIKLDFFLPKLLQACLYASKQAK